MWQRLVTTGWSVFVIEVVVFSVFAMNGENSGQELEFSFGLGVYYYLSFLDD
jgi:hypothetical protein